jgi:hypothetical protein
MMYPNRARTYKKTSFRVKRPIRSFRDLEVYQRTSQLAAEVMTKVAPLVDGKDCPIKDKLISACLDIPTSLAVAHSRRFEKGDELKIMETIMEECNKVTVYLEQVRDIFVQDIDRALCEDLIKRYAYARRKILNLYRAWVRFREEHQRQ